MRSLFTEQQWYWVAERFREGYTIGALAEFLGVHRETVRRWLVRQGFKPPNRRTLRPLGEKLMEFNSLPEKEEKTGGESVSLGGEEDGAGEGGPVGSAGGSAAAAAGGPAGES